jgi:hypothetical protein
MASGGPADPGSWNRYAYVAGDPVNRVDPSGREYIDITAALLANLGLMRSDSVTVDGGAAATVDTLWLYSHYFGRDSHFTKAFNDQGNGGKFEKDGPSGPTRCPQTPDHPPGVDINQNIQIVKAKVDELFKNWQQNEAPNGVAVTSFLTEVLVWFYDQVRNHAPWDYKQNGSPFQDFGNFNFGATGTAAGLEAGLLLRAAGFAQIVAGTSTPDWGNPLGGAPYGDDPADQAQIKAGMRYYWAWLSGLCP